jgi:hypothetical protein
MKWARLRVLARALPEVAIGTSHGTPALPRHPRGSWASSTDATREDIVEQTFDGIHRRG